MAGTVRATATTAIARGLLLAIVTAAVAFATAELRIHDHCKRGHTHAQKARYASCKAHLHDRKHDAIWESVLAGLTALTVRGGLEGGWDARRQAKGRVTASDVQ
jgi:hypothetical protein